MGTLGGVVHVWLLQPMGCVEDVAWRGVECLVACMLWLSHVLPCKKIEKKSEQSELTYVYVI